MKKILCGIMALTLLGSLFSCGGDSKSEDTPAPGKKTEIVLEHGGHTVIKYDDSGRVVEKRYISADNEDGSTTYYEYDSEGRILKTNDGEQQEYVYDSNGNVLKENIGKGKTTYTYDDNGKALTKKIKYVIGDSEDIEYTYENGVLSREVRTMKTTTERKDEFEEYVYIKGELTIVTSIEYTYEGGKLTLEEHHVKNNYVYNDGYTDSDEEDVSYEYTYLAEESYEVTEFIDGEPTGVFKRYDKDGNLIAERGYSKSMLGVWWYDYTVEFSNGNKIVRKEWESGSYNETVYDEYGDIIKEDNGTDGFTVKIERNSDGAIVSYHKRDIATGDTLEKYSKEYDKNGICIKVKDETDEVNRWDSEYSPADRHIKHTRYDKRNSADRVYEYSYDDDGNMTSEMLYKNGTFECRYDYTYDENGKKLDRVECDENGNPIG